MEFLSREKNLHILCWIIMLGYFLPYVLLGEDISITIHDNLDSNLVWLKLVIENTTLFSPIDTTIPQIMGGMPLSSLAPVYDPQFFIFKTFGIFNGYVIIRFLMLVIGFYGMRALLNTHVTLQCPPQAWSGTSHSSGCIAYSPAKCGEGSSNIERSKTKNAVISSDQAREGLIVSRYLSDSSLVHRSLDAESHANAGKLNTPCSILTTNYSLLITYGVAVCYALLPHWGYNLSIATLPLYFLILLNIQNRRASKWDYLGLILIGLTSSLILVSMFVLAGFGLYGLLQWVTKRISPLRLYGALLIISAVSLLTYWRIVAGVLNPSGAISHRTEFDLLYNWYGTIFSRTTQLLTDGQYHAASIHQLILMLLPIALWLIWKKAKDYTFINAIEFIIISCLWYSIVNWSAAAPLISIVTDIVPIQLGRLHFIQPLVWYVLFALSLFYLVKHTKWGKTAAPILIAAQIVILFFHHEGYTQRNQPSYKAFYATALFDDVKAYLATDPEYTGTERSIFISSHPAILQYNGFNTLDGYLADYPLSYKHAFGEIIQGELDKNPKLAKSFNNWGSRAYAVSSQLGKEWLHPKLPMKENQSPPPSAVNNHPSPRGEGLGEGALRASSEVTPLNALSYNWQAFTNLGGKYIFSPLPISDPALNHLKTFNHPDAAWTIYLYVLNREL